jgi:uncharacterized surface protein with fasciclin (FAS1) repeats
MSNITQVVNVDKHMTTLKKAVMASDLDQVLSSTGPYTFFAPSDIAFEKLEKGLLETLLQPENKARLIDFLNDHVVAGKIYFKDLKDGEKLNTVNGNELLVHVKNGEVTINTARLKSYDAKISNGVIHSLDTVMVKN